MRCVRRGDASRAHHRTTKPQCNAQRQNTAALARRAAAFPVVKRKEGHRPYHAAVPLIIFAGSLRERQCSGEKEGGISTSGEIWGCVDTVMAI